MSRFVIEKNGKYIGERHCGETYSADNDGPWVPLAKAFRYWIYPDFDLAVREHGGRILMTEYAEGLEAQRVMPGNPTVAHDFDADLKKTTTWHTIPAVIFNESQADILEVGDCALTAKGVDQLIAALRAARSQMKGGA